MNAKERIEIKDVKKELDEIKNYLYDNKQTGQDGLIHKFEDLDNKVDEILLDIRFAKWVAAAVAAISAFVSTLVVELFKSRF